MRVEQADLVVVGGGMSGVSAAIAAARRGRDVWLIEPSNVVGGQGTGGGVAGFCGDTAKVNAVFDELVERLAAHDFIAPLNPLADRREFELEWCAFFLQEMLLESGVQVLLHSRVLDAQASGGRVSALTVSSAGEVFEMRPRVVVDATGLCLVAERAGFPVQHDGANKQLPMSLYFTLWDSGEPVTPFLPDGLPRWQHDDEIPMTSLHVFGSGKVEVKMKVTGFDAADGLSLSQAEMHARRQMVALIYYLQTHGYRGRVLDRHVLAGVSRHIGIREQRRLVGDYMLTEHDVKHGCVFDDAVAVGTYHLDYHWTDRPERDGTGITTMVEPYQIPLRCMIPRGAKNLLVPGRGAAAEQMALSSFRVMATVAQMGFACGVAAAQAAAADVDITALDLPRLQAELEAGGQDLDLNHYGQYLRNTICTRQTIAETGPVDRLHLQRRPHGGFRVSYQQGDACHSLDRLRAAWGDPLAADAVPDPVHMLMLNTGHQIRLGRDTATGALILRLDDAQLALEPVDTLDACSLVETPRGIALAYADSAGQLRFWHGAVEHIMGTGVSHDEDHRF